MDVGAWVCLGILALVLAVVAPVLVPLLVIPLLALQEQPLGPGALSRGA